MNELGLLSPRDRDPSGSAQAIPMNKPPIENKWAKNFDDRPNGMGGFFTAGKT